MSSRSGAALIIAIVVLAAMLLLGLPFLFTQSSSLSGTRSYSHGRLASLGQDSAQSMGVAAGASAMSYRWQQVDVPPDAVSPRQIDDWTHLFHSLAGSDPDSGLHRLGNRIEFNTRHHTYALPGEEFLKGLKNEDRDQLLQRYPTTVGLAIEDESGKLDPNYLDLRSWTRLLDKVGIVDWTNGQIPEADPGRRQLARALSLLRYQLPGRRITSLEQLLQAEPPATITGTDTPVSRPRRALTRAELDRLRPHLTIHNLSQARGGMIDLGTVLGVNGAHITLDHNAPEALLAYPIAPQLIGAGTALLVSDPDDGSVHSQGRFFGMPAIGETSRYPRVNAAVAIDAPPTVNIHQTDEVVRHSYAFGPLPTTVDPVAPTKEVPNPPPRPALLTELNGLNPLQPDELGRTRTAFDLMAPLAVYDRRGTTHVLASRRNDPNVSGDFDANNNLIDATTGKPILHHRATTIHIVTGSLDLFPPSGYAKIYYRANEAEYEIIEYNRSVPLLPLSPVEVATNKVEVTLYITRRGINGPARPFFSGSSVSAPDSPTDLHLVALVPYEQHPIGIASQGAITIASTATVTDAVGHQTAQDQHRVVAQTLPQETPLETRWEKQAQFHALLAQRQGSLLTSFPQPTNRVNGILPQDGPNLDASSTRVEPLIDPDDNDRSVGVRPAIMRTLLTHSHLDHSYRIPFSGASGNVLKDSNGTPSMSNPVYTASDITPEGLRLDDQRVLYYPNPGNRGMLRDSYVPPPPPAPAPALVPLESIHGRQFGLWIRPDETWTDPVVLFDCQMPDENVAESLSGALLPDNPFDARGVIQKGASNLFRLAYIPKQKLLILFLNPGTVQQAADYGPRIPRELFRDPGDGSLPLRSGVYPAVNPECLGYGGIHRMAAAAPNNAQSIQHCYYVGDRLVAGEWSQIQVAFTSNQPGGMSIIVDGLVGRDVTRLASAATPPAMTVPGDHVTLPSLVLRSDIADTPTVADVGAKALALAEIPLDAIARSRTDGKIITGAAAVRDVLPPRGIIRIADEYISYEDISDKGELLRCVRGRRQRTDAGSWGGSHRLQAHRAGDLVVPGGFAMKNLGGEWWRGGCSLKHPFPDGDRNNLYRVAVDLAVKAENRAPYIELRERTGAEPLQLPELLRQEHGFLLWNQFIAANPDSTPPQPAVIIPHLLYFIRDPKLQADQLRIWHWNSVAQTVDVPVVPPTIPPTTVSITIPQGWVAGIPYGQEIPAGTEMVLVSSVLNGDPTSISRAYDWLYTDRDDNPFRVVDVSADRIDYDARMVQLYDARDSAPGTNGGRAEWIAYTSIESRPTGDDRRKQFPTLDGKPAERRTYLMNLMRMQENGLPLIRGGFWFNELYRTGARARQRTAFAASDFSAGLYHPTNHRFPAGTRVIPVQTTITSPDAQAAGKDPYPVTPLLEAGDMVTLAPVALGNGQKPLQMCVRYSANDGFPETKVAMPGPTDPVPWNVMNRFFAFSEAIPSTWNPSNQNFHLLAWPCWTPEVDLSPSKLESWALQRLGWVLPWGTAYAPDYRPDQNNRGEDRPIAIGLSTDPNKPGIIATIDAIHAGGINGWSDDEGRTENPSELVQANILPPSADPWLLNEALTAPVDIQVDAPVFAWPYGLVDIGGEVFAYKRLTPQNHGNRLAQLIGRSLLGSVRREHQGRELILHLPIGPVAEVIGGIQPPPPEGQPPPAAIGLPFNRVGAVQFSGYFAAPAMLLTSRNGDTMELTTMPNGHTAPWLRGLYNTTPVEWEPRVSAAMLPNLAPLAIGWWPRYPSGYPNKPAPDYFGEYMACRSYAWAGFPLRFHNCRFLQEPEMAMVQVLSTGNGLFALNALALDASLDWNLAEQVVITDDGSVPSAPVDVTAAFATERFLTGTGERISPRLGYSAATPRTVDGAELRVMWSYRAPRLTSAIGPAKWLQQAAKNGNNAPMIGPVRMRTYAPNQVLNVER